LTYSNIYVKYIITDFGWHAISFLEQGVLRMARQSIYYDTGCNVPQALIAHQLGGEAVENHIFFKTHQLTAEIISGNMVAIPAHRSLSPVHKRAMQIFQPLDIDEFAEKISACTG
jgi:hypothetical protein